MAGLESLKAATAIASARLTEFFENAGEDTWQVIAETMPMESLQANLPVVTSFPRAQKWLGSKVFKRFRAYDHSIKMDSYSAGVEIDRRFVDYDNTGAVNRMVNGLTNSAADSLTAITMDYLLENNTAYDGVNLFSNAHPHSNGTGDNLVTTALSHVNVRALDAQMRGFQDEEGRPLGVNPDTLIVPPSSTDLALEIAGADKPIYFNSSAAEATTSVVDGIVIRNVRAGKYDVIESNEMPSGTWLLEDRSKNGMRPIILGVGSQFDLYEQTERSDHAPFNRNVYQMSLDGDYGIGTGLWQLIAGKIS